MAAPTNTKLQIHPSRAVPVASTGPPPPLPSGGGGGSAAAAPAPAAPQTSKPAVQPNLKAGKLLPSVTVLMPGAGSQILQKVSAAEDAIRRDPYDVDAWLVLWNVASGNTLSLSISRVIYEQFLLLFPTAVSGVVWCGVSGCVWFRLIRSDSIDVCLLLVLIGFAVALLEAIYRRGNER